MENYDSQEIQIGKNPLICTKSNRILLILISSIMTGIAWRIRGETGFGGMWGMIVPATFLTSLVFIIWGRENKMNAAMFGFLVMMMSVTANGWGTIISQPTGTLGTFDGHIQINPLSGVFWIFCVGFGWAPLWAIAIGLLFSKKKFDFGDFFKAFIVYIVFRMLSEFVFSHLIIPIVSPEAYELFANSLSGMDGSPSPWSFYISHWKDSGLYKSIDGGRNYAAMVSNISSCIGVIFAYIFMRFALKDKDAAKLEIRICLIFGVSITIADIWKFLGSGGLWRTSFNPPDWLPGDAWGLWEYTTGFLLGCFIMLLLVRYSRKESAKDRVVMMSNAQYFPEKLEPWVKFIFYLGMVCCAAWISPLADRSDLIWGVEGLEIFIYLICGIPALIISILYFTGKIKFPKKTITFYSFMGSIIFAVVYFIVYFLSRRIPTFLDSVLNPIMLISYVIIFILFRVFYDRNKKFINNIPQND